MQTYSGCEVWAGQRMVLSYGRNPDAENLANARLMAASKDLLEALEYLTTADESHLDAALRQAKTAIDKAIGDNQ